MISLLKDCLSLTPILLSPLYVHGFSVLFKGVCYVLCVMLRSKHLLYAILFNLCTCSIQTRTHNTRVHTHEHLCSDRFIFIHIFIGIHNHSVIKIQHIQNSKLCRNRKWPASVWERTVAPRNYFV